MPEAEVSSLGPGGAGAELPKAGDTSQPTIRTFKDRGATGYQAWRAGHLLAEALLRMDLAPQVEPGGAPRLAEAQARGCVLELGAGAGETAIMLASAGWRKIIATDGESGIVRNMKYNVLSNKLGHAVQCKCWDWASPAPSGIDLASVDLCIGADVVYYDRPHSDLAALLRKVLAARAAGRARPRALLMLTLRHAVREGGQVCHKGSTNGYAGGSIERFVEEELPAENLVARLVDPIPGEEDVEGSSFRLYEVFEAPSS